MFVRLVDNLLFEGDADHPVFDLQPHLGLISLTQSVRDAGHCADIFDPKLALIDGRLAWGPSLYDGAAELILAGSPDVVGFTALGCNFHCVVHIAEAVRRRRPELPILLGGPHASILHREILTAMECFDAVVRNEAEATLPALLAVLGTTAMADVPGVSWRDSQGRIVCNPGAPKVEDLDALPLGSFDDYPLARLGLAAIRVEAGRGCPFSCTFCSTASYFGRSYRIKSSRRLAAEMDRLATEHGFREFKLTHDLFTVNRKKVLAFCSEIAPRSYRWACSARVDCVDSELLETMAAAGCVSIYFGIETGSAAVQESSRKRLDLTLVDATLATTEALGIATTTSFIIGYPQESAADRSETIAMAGRLHRRPLNKSQLHLLTPEPGTAMLDMHRNRLRFDSRSFGFNLPRFGKADDLLIAAYPDIFPMHYYYEGLVAHDSNLFCAALWQQLAVIDAPVYAALVDNWDGCLAALMEDAFAWWVGEGLAEDAIAPDTLARFAMACFDLHVPLVSALRYAAACRVRLGHREALPEAGAAPRPARYRLRPGTQVIRAIHDTDDIARLPLCEPGGTLSDVVVVRPPGQADSFHSYRIDPLAADLLLLVDTPDGPGLLSHVEAADIARLETAGILEAATGVPA